MSKQTKSEGVKPAPSFQDLILKLERFWADQGCVILQPYDMEVGAATFHPATTLRSLGPKPWRAAYVQPSRRPKDGRYGENPNRLQHYYQFQVILKPSPPDIQDLYLESLYAIGIDPKNHDIRFVEDDWESPTLGAWGLGWEVWCDGMEVSQFTYFQQVGGFDCDPVSGELTYGLERLAMYVQGVDNVYDLNFNGREGIARQGRERRATSHGAPRLRSGHQGLAHFQCPRCARRDLRARAPILHLTGARTRQGVLRGMAQDRGGRGARQWLNFCLSSSPRRSLRACKAARGRIWRASSATS
jgi:hypothetical protein